MRKYIEKQLTELNDLLLKYDKLNKKTGQQYAWRTTSLINEIGTLEAILRKDELKKDWEICYQEDSNEK